MAGLVKQTPGAIGYVELIYALTNKIAYGSVQNMAGKFVKASTESVTAAAAAAAKQMPADFRVSITNAAGDDGAYPISSFTWLLLYENPQDKAQAKAMVDFMKWALTDGQKFAPEMGYAPLPQGGRRPRAEGAGEDQDRSRWLKPPISSTRPDEILFRVGTGAFAVAPHRRWSLAIGVELYRQSQLSIRSSAGSSGRPTSGIRSPAQFGARPFIWGTLYSSVLALLISTPIALGIAIYISELAPQLAPHAARLPDRAARGDPVDRLRAVGHLRAGAVRAPARERRRRSG